MAHRVLSRVLLGGALAVGMLALASLRRAGATAAWELYWAPLASACSCLVALALASRATPFSADRGLAAGAACLGFATFAVPELLSSASVRLAVVMAAASGVLLLGLRLWATNRGAGGVAMALGAGIAAFGLGHGALATFVFSQESLARPLPERVAWCREITVLLLAGACLLVLGAGCALRRQEAVRS